MTGTTTTRSKDPAKASRAALLKRLKLSPEVAWYMEDRGIPLPDCPPQHKTPEPSWVEGAQFDPDRVDKVLRVFHSLRHTKGKWAGQPLDPAPWQVAYIIAPVFGWVRFDSDADRWVRIIRELYVDVPRKNGKSTLLGGMAVYMLAADGEHGAECLTAATTKEQASFVFAPVKVLCDKAPALKGRVKPFASVITHPKTGSYFKPIANVADAQHGANIHFGCVDELHVHKDPTLVETLETGTGSRDQPLMAFITTADDGTPFTIYARKRDKIEKLARRVIKSATTYGVIWGAERSDDPYSVETQKKANPGYGISPTAPYLAKKAEDAQNSPAELAAYQRLHLGIRTKQTTMYITLPQWNATAGLVDEWRLGGRACFGGIDLSAVEDLSALAWEFPDGEGGFDVLWRFWLPEDRAPDLSLRTAGNSDGWIRDGFIKLTPGNVIDLDFIYERVKSDAAKFDVKTIGFDRWGANPLVTKIGDLGYECVPRGQGYATASAPLKDIKRLILIKKYRHSGNPVMVWMTDNLAVTMDASGNVKPDKARAAEKIDGWSAVVNAHGEYMDNAAAEEAPAKHASPGVLERTAVPRVAGGIESAGF